MVEVKRELTRGALALWEPFARRAGRAYIAGPDVSDAERACRELWDAGMRAVVCYWNEEDAPPRLVADRSLAALDALAGGHLYLSIKAPALDFSVELCQEIAARAAERSVRVHFDAQRPEHVERMRRLAERMLSGPAPIGFTLPGRFSRSARDAAWAIDEGLPVRLVKGQAPDPEAPRLDPGRGVLDLVDVLAGRGRLVAVASHDAPLVREALRRLVRSQTPCELELLLGLPLGPALREARLLGVPVRVYVPFGAARLPYHLTDARRNPRVLSWMARDLARSRPGAPPPPRAEELIAPA